MKEAAGGAGGTRELLPTAARALSASPSAPLVRPAPLPRRAPFTLCAALCALLALCGVLTPPAARAQAGSEERPEELSPEPPPPPRILEDERARRAVPAQKPDPQGGQSSGPPPAIADTPLAAALAPPREDGTDELEEVVVVGTPLRLPDLGSRLRAEREAERDQGRIAVAFLPLYDPESPPPNLDDPLFRNRELERVGFIELFRIQFGHRSRK